jgi:hypothetical protein
MDPRFTGSNPAEGDGFLRVTKICSTFSFGGEVKTQPRCQFLLLCYKINMLVGLPELWWTNQEFFPVDLILPWFSMLIYHL